MTINLLEKNTIVLHRFQVVIFQKFIKLISNSYYIIQRDLQHDI